MSRPFARFPPLVLAGLALAVLTPAAARAAVVPHDAGPGMVQLDQPAYTAHENQGYLTITIERSGDLSGEEHVGYGSSARMRSRASTSTSSTTTTSPSRPARAPTSSTSASSTRG